MLLGRNSAYSVELFVSSSGSMEDNNTMSANSEGL